MHDHNIFETECDRRAVCKIKLTTRKMCTNWIHCNLNINRSRVKVLRCASWQHSSWACICSYMGHKSLISKPMYFIQLFQLICKLLLYHRIQFLTLNSLLFAVLFHINRIRNSWYWHNSWTKSVFTAKSRLQLWQTKCAFRIGASFANGQCIQ